jgi:hypothetical protein
MLAMISERAKLNGTKRSHYIHRVLKEVLSGIIVLIAVIILRCLSIFSTRTTEMMCEFILPWVALFLSHHHYSLEDEYKTGNR